MGLSNIVPPHNNPSTIEYSHALQFGYLTAEVSFSRGRVALYPPLQPHPFLQLYTHSAFPSKKSITSS